MPKHTRNLLPLSGEERELCHSLGLSDEFVRDLDDLLFTTTHRPLRAVLFAVLRKMKRAGCTRRPPSASASSPPATTSRNGPTSETVARFDQAVMHVAQGGQPLQNRSGQGKRA